MLYIQLYSFASKYLIASDSLFLYMENEHLYNILLCAIIDIFDSFYMQLINSLHYNQVYVPYLIYET